MAIADEREDRPAGFGPRGLALVGLLAGAVGFAAAVVPAITGPGGLAAGYLALLSGYYLTLLVVVLIALGAVVALLTKRASGIALMLASAIFFVGYFGGYFVVQYLGVYYRR